ncbi:MAG: hypothetical protein J6X44_01250 [Thermoguttaceae bacterium]|nr:hypothetical protein [Thermoguttaceae bacterium]
MSKSDVAGASQDVQSESSALLARKKRLLAVREWFSSSLGSIVLHALLLLFLIWAIRSDNDGSFRGERRADEVGIVLSDSKTPAELKDASDPSGDSNLYTEETVRTSESFDSSNKTNNLKSVVDQLLPSNEIGVSNESANYSSALGSELQGGGSDDGVGQSVGFGDVRGSGRKFVYVLDRSDSMSWNGGEPMRRAIADAINSVNSLDPQRGANKFQIVVYNHDVETFDRGTPLVDVNPASKARAVRYLRSLVATGGTSPEKALETGIKLRPDVVFFLTDADEELTSHTLATIRSLRSQYKVKQICVVEFGKASEPRKRSFRQLAGENNGTYVFKNIESF